ncbi:MAG: Holliday junction resolvase RuvX [Acidimicrobiia bacterium]
MRALGVDLGSRRIGIAVSDGGGRVATPLATVERKGRDLAGVHRVLAELVAEWEAEIVVVGLPLSLDGTVGPAARAVLDEVDELARAVAVDVVTHDERLSTVTAHERLQAAGVAGRDRRRLVDRSAAAVFLQSWLDGRRPSGDAGTPA